MEINHDFRCSYQDCPEDFYFAPCNEPCCKGLDMCYCRDHNDPSKHAKSRLVGDSQESLLPADSITNVSGFSTEGTNFVEDSCLSSIELTILDGFTPSKKCLSRSLFDKVNIFEK